VLRINPDFLLLPRVITFSDMIHKAVFGVEGRDFLTGGSDFVSVLVFVVLGESP
jgi:hypothetical protein